jgi:hypothetical protein
LHGETPQDTADTVSPERSTYRRPDSIATSGATSSSSSPASSSSAVKRAVRPMAGEDGAHDPRSCAALIAETSCSSGAWSHMRRAC